MGKARDWDKELAKIDALISKEVGPLEEPAPAQPAGQAPAKPEAHAQPGRGAVVQRLVGGTLGAWGRLGLGAVLGVAMTQWPYAHDCGGPLLAYLAGGATVVGAGAWSGVNAWARRLGMVHALSIAIMIWGVILAGREVIPRVDDVGGDARWTCTAP